MPTFKYTAEDPRYYPDHGLEVEAGSTADFEDDPGDGRWEKQADPKSKSTKSDAASASKE